MTLLQAFTLMIAFSSLGTAALATPSRNSSDVCTACLQHRLDKLVRRARPGILGVAVLDLQSGTQWRANAGYAFPMMSVFKAPVAAAVLSRIDAGELSMDRLVTVEGEDLESGTIRDHFRGEQMQFSVRQLLSFAVSKSDNTAVDALLKVVGGPGIATAFLRAHGIEGMRVDMGESGISRVFENLGQGHHLPGRESAAQELTRLRRGYKAYLTDPRNLQHSRGCFKFSKEIVERGTASPSVDCLSPESDVRPDNATPAACRPSFRCSPG